MRANRVGPALIIGLLLFGFACNKQAPSSSSDEIDKIVQQFNQYKFNQTNSLAKATQLGEDVFTELGILKVMAANNIPLNKGKLFDEFYIGCPRTFVFNDINNALFDFTKRSGIFYEPEASDCDNWTLMSMVCAQREYFFKRKDKRPVSILFGEFHYKKDFGGYHAINIFITPNQEVGFFEPQDNKIVSLSKNEIASCLFWRF